MLSVYKVKNARVVVERWSESQHQFVDVSEMNPYHVLNCLRKDLLAERDNENVMESPLFKAYFKVLFESSDANVDI